MLCIKKSLVGVVAVALLLALFAPRSFAAADENRLLDLLVKKGIVTKEEASALREEISKDEASQRAQAVVEKQAQEAQKKEQAVTSTSPFRLSGFVQTRFTTAVNTTNSLELRRARLALDGDFGQKISYRLQLDAVRSPVLLDARVDFKLLPYARVTFGQFKVPFSQENLISSRDLIPIERSLVVNNLVPGRDTGNNGRDIGVQLAGSLVRASGKPLVDYSVGFFNGAGINRRDDNRRKDGAVRVVAHPFSGFSVAGDYYNGATGATSLQKERAGFELAYARKLFSFRGEYIWGHDGALRKNGWYSQFVYRLGEKWQTFFRFDNFDPNRQTKNNATNTYLLGFNVFLAKYVKLQANYGVADEQVRPHPSQTALIQLQFQY